VDDASLLTTNGTQIAADVVTLLAAFFTKYPSFQTTPFYIACESYGGHMTVEIAAALLDAIDAGTVKTNFKGIGLGDSWVSPIDYVQAWGPYLQATSLIDSTDAAALAPVVAQTAAAVAAGQWTQATNLWGQVEGVVGSLTSGVNWYNILDYDGAEVAAAAARATLSPLAVAAAPAGADLPTLARLWYRHVAAPYGQRLGDPLSDLMNGQIRTQVSMRWTDGNGWTTGR
jgi:serine carboxypeptidase 1